MASAPSRIAVHTSEISARVGRTWATIDSSIWVATMTGMFAARARRTRSFWICGTSSSGTSRPRSPRATMMPSTMPHDAAEVRQRLAALDLGDDRRRGRRRLSRKARTSSISAGERTKDTRDEVDAVLNAEDDVLAVLVGEARDRQGDVREGDALVIADAAARDDAAVDGVLDHLLHLAARSSRRPSERCHRASALSRHSARRHRRQLPRPRDLSRHEREALSGLEVHALAAGRAERAEPDLRSLQVLEDGDRPARALLGLADVAGSPRRARRVCRARSSGGPRPCPRRRGGRASRTSEDDGPIVQTIFVWRMALLFPFPAACDDAVPESGRL